MTTPKTVCLACGADYPVGSTCPRCGPHKPGAVLLEALRSHGSGIAPDPFEQAECQDCADKDRLIKVAGEQIEALQQKVADAAKAEREACAAYLDRQADHYDEHADDAKLHARFDLWSEWKNRAERCRQYAATIRARSS